MPTLPEVRSLFNLFSSTKTQRHEEEHVIAQLIGVYS